uniref:p-glycoprotein n=1 Tax=Panagrolaimus sp. ES5 TaxID=591445 RepID=A0AC34FTX7_9BILA
MGIVEQSPVLFNLTVRKNIAYGIDNVSEEEIIKAAKLAKIHEFVQSLPQNYETIVGQR